MIKVIDDDIITNHNLYMKAYKSSANAAFLENAFVAKSFPKMEREANRVYPYDVKIPKALPYLSAGDFTPEQIIRITEPVKGLYSNIWFGDASDGVYLRAGYENGDSRYVCKQRLDDADIHMVLGGSTGQGKSVTLNAIIFGLCMEYAPWELALTLCDAKIVEFKSYAIQTPMKHIRSIAATSDTDYLISVLSSLEQEMLQLNKVLVNAGVKKISDFRKETGLCIPQNIIIIDEFQSMFKFAGKKAGILEKILASFAKLGRNTGYHLLLASQELGSEISKDTLANIKVRAAVGCDGSVSEKLLGNDAAKNNLGKKGRLLFNTEASSDNSKLHNRLIRVPFMPDDQRIKIGEDLIRVSELMGFKRVMGFYDEDAIIDESHFLDFLKKWKLKNNSIILGEPSFVMDGDEKVLRLEFSGKDIENICVITVGNNNVRRYFRMLQKNMVLHTDGALQLVVSADNVFTEDLNAAELANPPKLFEESKDFNCTMMDIAFKTIVRRKIMLAVDNAIFVGGQEYDRSYDDVFYEYFQQGGQYDTELNKCRFYVAVNLLRGDDEWRLQLGFDGFGGEDAMKHLYVQSQIIVETFSVYDSADTRIQKKNLKPLYVWLLGMNKVLGLGRDTKTKYVEKFKKAMQDSSAVEVRFILFTSTMADINDLHNGIRWYLLDGISSQELSKIKASEFYPGQISSVSCVLYDSQAPMDKCVKFKKMALDGENL